jgi:mannan endo-1,4-beta-mannosidase
MNQKQFLSLLVMAFFLFSCKKNAEFLFNPAEQSMGTANQAGAKAVPQAAARTNKTKQTVLNYIAGMKNNWQIISGQQCGDGDEIATGYGTFMDGLYNLTAKYPAICGADYGYKVNNLNTINQKLISHWNAGGLVAISWHADYPWASGYNSRYNSVTYKNTINFNALTKRAGASSAKTNYRNELHNVATALQALKNAGVIVIWRPFHEMNSDYFWWGINAYNNQQTNTAAYKNFWIDLYNTLRWDYGLDNLIWVFSSDVNMSWNANLTAYYPGNDYVDLVGEDVYSPVGDIPDYNTLTSFGKPVVLSECGPDAATYGNYDVRTMVEKVKGKACYFLQWHSFGNAKIAIKDNKRYMEAIHGGDVISRDEVQ